jgi:Protein of unknown function (DUF1257)
MDYVKRGLLEMGFDYKENVVITDYYGQKRHAELAVVRNGNLLPLGWVRNQETNELELQADWFKVPYSQKKFVDTIAQLHSKYHVLQVCEENRWHVDEDSITMNENGEIEILATQWA